MSNPENRPAATGVCWFCGRGPGGEQSVALPFWSNIGDEVRVLVLPRCNGCAEFHHRQQFPSGLIIVGCAALPLIAVSQLPLSETWRTPVSVLALLAGFASGIVFVADREGRQAQARGTRPLFDYVQHPPYHALAADTANWRQARTTGMGDGDSTSTRRETVADHRRYFSGIVNDTVALAALERACVEAGLVSEPSG